MNASHVYVPLRLVVVSKLIKKYLGWDVGSAPVGHHVLTKKLASIGIHTYIGMLGYCVKDRGEDYFEVVYNNVTDAKLVEGLEEFVKHATSFAKTKIVLTSRNLLERVATYLKFKMKNQLGSTLPGVLLMLQSGTFIPDSQWVVPQSCGGMDSIRAAAMWKCMVCPATLQMEDICHIFFLHTDPGSRLRDLGRQRLTADLTATCQGT
jgi:hypothetical protein